MKIKSLLFISLCLLCKFCLAQKQGQAQIDSMISLLPAFKEDTNKVKLLTEISYSYPYTNPNAGIQYGNEALLLAKKLSFIEGIASANYAIGGNYINKADYANALRYDYESLKIYEKLNDIPKQAMLLRNLGIVYQRSKNHDKALEYDFKALELYRALNDSEGVAALYNNISNVYYRLDKREKVLEYNLKSLQMYRDINNASGEARLLGNIANFYAEDGKFNQAMVYYFDALRRETALDNKNGVTRNMGNIGETYFDIYNDDSGLIKPDSLIPKGREANLQKALYFLKSTIDNAKELGQTEYFLAFAEILSEAYMLDGNNSAAFKLYKEYIAVRDSVYDIEKYNAATRRELDYEYGKREDSISFQQKISEVRLADEQKMRTREKTFYSIGIVLVLIFSAFMFNRWRVTKQQKRIIEKEKKRSEDLLLNILPFEVAEELKLNGVAEARNFDSVTIMFTDFKGFTSISEQLTAQKLVAEIDYCFSEFDKIISKYKIEKIKTIGDAYMCAGGLPEANLSHAEDVVNAAIEIRDFILNYEKEKRANNEPSFEVRIGIHSGPVVAGIVGIKKFSYDIWGDTVNTAARMESSGEIGKVNISETTYELVKEKFNCIHRGKITAKGKGEIDMYFVEATPIA